jgi:hypothetical protein
VTTQTFEPASAASASVAAEPAPSCAASSAAQARRRTVVGMLVVFVVSLLVYWVSPVRFESDSFWVTNTARSLVKDGNADLDEYSTLVHWNRGFQTERRDGHVYYSVPLGTSLAAVPVIAFAAVVDPDLDRHLAKGTNGPWDGITAALLAAATVAVVFAIARRRTNRLWVAYLTAFVFAFGTQAWGIASRTVWMQAPSMLCLSLALLFALRASRSRRWFAPLGAVLALAYFVRPTNAVPLVVFGVWVLVKHRAHVTRYVLGAAAVTAAFVTANLVLYGELLQPYFRASRLSLTPTVAQALLANLVSPSRGIFVFVPVSILVVLGFRMRMKAGELTSLDVAVAVTIAVYWIGVSCFPDWTGGWSYGPRFLLDVVPLMMWFLPPIFDALARSRNALLTGLTVLLIVLSVGIQARGAFVERTATWNWEPRFLDPARVWDWSDPQFLA